MRPYNKIAKLLAHFYTAEYAGKHDQRYILRVEDVQAILHVIDIPPDFVREINRHLIDYDLGLFTWNADPKKQFWAVFRVTTALRWRPITKKLLSQAIIRMDL